MSSRNFSWHEWRYLSNAHYPTTPSSRHGCILPIQPVGQGSDKVEKVYVFGGYRVKKSENLRLYHFATGDKVYKTRPFFDAYKAATVAVSPPWRGRASGTATNGRGFMGIPQTEN
jgi:hypothetical protein